MKEFENKYRSKIRLSDKHNTGFTLFEVIIVIAILSLLAVIPVANFVLLQKRTELNNSIQELAGVISLAQNKTLASESNSQFGVYLDTTVSPNRYILFQGATYGTRNTSADNVYLLKSSMEFYEISLGGGNEIDFNRLTGEPEQFGSISIRVKTDTSQNKIVYISNSGAVSFSEQPVLSDENRVKDTRHLTFDYSRYIDVNNESVILTFDGSVTKQILISQYLMAGELDWEGSVDVNGASQKIHIHTNRLNNTDTQFSVLRDRRYNDKSLVITISGDGSGNLAQYSADGLTTGFLSTYVSNFYFQ